MKPIRRSIGALAAVALLAAGVPLQAGEGGGEESWFVVKISGAPVGFASETTIQEEDATIYRSHTNLSMKRLGTPLSMFLITEEVTDASGAFRSARMEMNASITGVRGSAVRRGDVVDFAFETSGHTEKSTIPWEDDAISLLESDRLSREWFGGDDEELTFKYFDVNEGRFKSMRLVRGEAQVQEVGGKARTLYAIAEYEGDGDTPLSTSWVDENGETVRTVVVQLGMEIVIERITRDEMASIELEPSFDIIRQSMISCEGYPAQPGELSTVTLDLEFAYPVPASQTFEGPNQSVLAQDDNRVSLLLTRATAKPMHEDETALAEYLSPGRYIQSDAEPIRAVADSVRAATGAEGWELARALSAWVGDHIAEKNYEQGFASALEVYETRAGDCTEHSVLLTALLRAAGVPARPAVGLAWSGDAFIGHMWVEAYVDHWRTLDALDPATDPIRVRVSAAGDRDAVDERGLVRAYAVVGGMKARVTASEAR